MNTPRTRTRLEPSAEMCEYLRDPFDECYCRRITGKSVPNIALYCMERFRECPVYRTRKRGTPRK
ncbi:MAG TPA: hypothetical protein VF795_00540 [Desulfuromonadaceae bacterium]